MNEDQKLQELFRPLQTDLHASQELRQDVNEFIASKRRPRRNLKWALAGGMLAIATAVIGSGLLVTSASAASKYHRIEAAIKDAQLMEIRSYAATPGKPRKLFGHIVYSHGDLRLSRSIIRLGSDQWYYLEHADVSVQEPLVTNPEIDRPQTALDFAKANSDEGAISSPRDFAFEERPNEGAREVYAIIATRKDTPYHMEMIVDKATNLPIRTTFSGESPTSPNYRVISEDYAFGSSVDPKLFDPQVKPTTKLLHMGVEAENWKRKWAKPIVESKVDEERCELRDITVTHTGNVFVLCTVPDRIDPKSSMPSNLLPDTLTDEQGRSYLLAQVIKPGGFFGDTQASDYFKMDNENVVICEFAPLQPSQHWTPASSLIFGLVGRTWVGAPVFRNESVTSRLMVKAPEPTMDRFPSYSDAMLLDDVHQQFEMLADLLRADIAEKAKQYKLAANWYRAAAKEAKPLSSYKTYDADAKRCEKLANNP